MGWSWAMYIAQRLHQNMCLEASQFPTSRLLVEGRPAPELDSGEVVLIPYADNLNVAGICQDRVREVKDLIVARLRQHGFRVHEETEASTLAQSLGFLIDGERLCITPIQFQIAGPKCCRLLSGFLQDPGSMAKPKQWSDF